MSPDVSRTGGQNEFPWSPFQREADAAWEFVTELQDEGEHLIADRLAVALSAAAVPRPKETT